MACPSCSKRKIMRQSSNTINLMQEQVYNDADFMSVYYVGSPMLIIGVVSMINYGVREYNQQMLVHKDDYNHESNNVNQLFALEPGEI